MRILAPVVAVAVLAACGGNDAEADKLQRQVDDLTRELATLRAELAARTAKAPVPVEAPIPVASPEEAALAAMPECRRYLLTLRAVLACDKVSDPAREALTKSAEMARETWHASMADDAREAASAACRSSTQALRDSARSLGCTMNLAERAP